MGKNKIEFVYRNKYQMQIINNYNIHTSLKSSGCEWIGEIPDGWSIRKLKWCLLPGKEGMRIGPFGSSLKLDIMVDDGIKVYGQENVISSDYSPDTGKRRISHEKFREMEVYEVFPDDILLSMMGSTGNFSRVPANVEKGIIDSHLLRIRFNELLNLDYFIYLSNYSAAISQQVEAVGKGSIMQGLNSSLVRQLWLPLPPLPEQQAIASFLDRETARINRIIEKQTRLIELLKEKRSALITQTVTRGLDPNAKMKDSGVEWIGEIPEGWEVRRLKYVARLKSGESITSDDIKTDGEYPVYGGNGLRGYCESFTHEGDYILIGRQGALCGNINYAKGKFWASEHAVVITPTTTIDVIWLGELLNVMNLNQYSISAAQPGLSVDRIKNLFIPFPRIEEQIDISNYIQNESHKTDSLITKIEKQIELLNEYKQSLITAAVTGKIDVRNVQ